ncbi:hypothetical protein GA829_15760 [Mesorhizobium sp. INR15]|nr:hypothetical protein GA829_15760 [Mesorhizobium sp. INR15]
MQLFVHHVTASSDGIWKTDWNKIPLITLAVPKGRRPMNNIIWLVGAVVIVLAILSFFGLR